MTRPRAIFALALALLALPSLLPGQQLEYIVKPLSDEGGVWYNFLTDEASGTNGVFVECGGAVLTADRVTFNWANYEVNAYGNVHVQREEQVWVSDHIRYNFQTERIESEQFRTGHAPVYAAGEGLRADTTNHTYTATNSYITTDDIANPLVRVRAKYIKIIPNDRIVAHNATLYVGDVPVFYFPYYSRRLGARANHFNFVPGYRSAYGPYLLSRYTWFLNEELDGVVRFDLRERRGVGAGPDLNYHLGPWGEGTVRYYYTHDENPNLNVPGGNIPQDRQRFYFSYQGTPYTNLSVKSMVRYQTDTNLVREYLEGEYRQNPQPDTFVEVNKFWHNFSVDTYVQPRVNNFLETVERLPEVRLTGFRQELGSSPFYYESQSSAGYYRQLFAETNSLPTGRDFEAARVDSFHQLLLPYTFFGWLNVTPRMGGRLTYYSQASGDGATTDERARGVFNTGAELTFKASQVWPGIEEKLLDVDGLRHIVQPSVNYVYVPGPNYTPSQLPQFDYEIPSLRLLPIEFPDYNAIDSVDSDNVVRLGLNNKLQTKRNGRVVNLANWDLYSDWRLRPRHDQTTFADLYSDLTFKPRSWLTLESLTRYDIENGLWRMSFHNLTIQPNEVWSWGLGHYYVRNDPVLGEGNNLFTSIMFYRLNENWALRAGHRFEARDGRMQEQDYSVYRDLRSWTAALTFRVVDNTTGPKDYTVAFTFSLKASPRYGLGTDIARPFSLLGD